jgi:hypothetical protein
MEDHEKIAHSTTVFTAKQLKEADIVAMAQPSSCNRSDYCRSIFWLIAS